MYVYHMQKLLDIGIGSGSSNCGLLKKHLFLLPSPLSFKPHQHFCLLFTFESAINMVESAEISLSLFSSCVSLPINRSMQSVYCIKVLRTDGSQGCVWAHSCLCVFGTFVYTFQFRWKMLKHWLQKVSIFLSIRTRRLFKKWWSYLLVLQYYNILYSSWENSCWK